MKAFALSSGLALLLFMVPATTAKTSPGPGLEPIRVIQSVTHKFPDRLALVFPKGGEARILVTVRSDGSLAEWLVIGYSAPPFKQEAIAALEELKFVPARLRGEPITARSELILHFEVKGMLVSTTPFGMFESMTRTTLELSNGYRPCRTSELDRLPAVLHSVGPSYPQELADKGVTGNVDVDFFIDEQGDVRMPCVLQPEPMVLLDAAVQAIRQWKFEPPLRDGKPVLVQARQTFSFFGEKPATAP